MSLASNRRAGHFGGAVRPLRSIGKNARAIAAPDRPLGLDPVTATGSFIFSIGFALVIYGSEVVAYFSPGLVRKHIRM